MRGVGRFHHNISTSQLGLVFSMENNPKTFKGRPCKHGHSGLRYKKAARCVECVKQFNYACAEEKKQYNKQYNKDHAEEVKQWHKQYNKDRRKTNIQYKLAYNLRTRLWYALKGNLKSGSAVHDLGCSIKELKAYLESKFKLEMTWDNYGKWHIDHMKPLVTFDLTDREQFLKANHYTNLQPLWAEENQIKSAKIDNNFEGIYADT